MPEEEKKKEPTVIDLTSSKSPATSSSKSPEPTPVKPPATASTKKKEPVKKAPKAKQAPDAPAQVGFHNTMFQVLSVEVKTAKGEFVSLEIPARSFKLWPKLSNYGADLNIKVKRGLIQIKPAS